jgi:hypothetical protein
MALVRNFRKSELEKNSVHDEIEASYAIFERDERILVQIDTFGRKSRQIPGKKSQTIQLDREGAEHLYKILKTAFRFD